jgi:hypothetical protein
MKRATFITWEQLKVGGMILLALGIMTVAVFKLGEAANLFSKRYRLLVLLPSAGILAHLLLQRLIDLHDDAKVSRRVGVRRQEVDRRHGAGQLPGDSH